MTGDHVGALVCVAGALLSVVSVIVHEMRAGKRNR